MADWNEGYFADIDYAYSYGRELNPLRTALAFLSKGLRPPRIETACELGFGQGLSLAVHAAAGGARWYGTDFSPSHTSVARDLVAASGADADLREQAFAEFCRDPDLPDFDFVAMHGIWSWINDQNRAVIVDFLRRKLKPGGVVYLGYNAAPGWAGFAPMRDLMKRYAEVMVSPGAGDIARIEAAVAFAARFIEANPDYAGINPTVAERVGKIKGQDRHYLAHEYFGSNWRPMHFSEMAPQLAPAKLAFACSARYLDHIDGINLTEQQIAMLAGIADPAFRETTRDLMVATRFRFDYWVKGPRSLPLLRHAEQLRAQRFVLVRPRAAVPSRISGSLRQAEMNQAVYGPVLDALADNRPHSLGEIEDSVRGDGLGLVQVVQAMLVLAGDGHASPAQDDAAAAAARKRTDRLNAHLVDRARDSADIGYLASPLTGGGIAVGRIQQLFLKARTEGRKRPQDWVDYVLPVMAAQGQKIIKEGRTLDSDDESRAELEQMAKGFAEDQLPILEALQVC